MRKKMTDWVKRLAAISQNGLTFAKDQYDIERYEQAGQIASEMLAELSGLESKKAWKILFHEEGYATPKVDVRGVVFQNEKILLVKELADGGWTLPGGWADVSQSPSENIVREVYEESGFQTRSVKLLAVYDRSKHSHEPELPWHVYKMFIKCEIIGGQAQVSNETTAVDFFGQDEIPDLSKSRVTPEQIQKMFEYHHNEDMATEFD